MSFLRRTFSFRHGSCSSSTSLQNNPSLNSNEELNSNNNKRIFKEEISFENINQKIDDWVLPPIALNALYKIQERGWFSRSDHIIRTVEESIPITSENDKHDYCLLSKKSIEKHRQNFTFLHIGSVQVAIKPLIRKGLNVSALVCLSDSRHNKFTDSLLAAAEFGLHNGPVYFNCYPDRMVELKDEHILEVLKLKIKLNGLDMKQGSIPATLTYRVHYKVSNSDTSFAQIPPDNGQTVVFLTDQTHVNLTVPKTIIWDEVELPEDWTLENVSNPTPCPVNQVSRITQHKDGSVKLAFDRPRRSSSSIIGSASVYEDCRSNIGSSRHSCSSFRNNTPSVIYAPAPPPKPQTQITQQHLPEINIQGVDNSSNIPQTTYQTETETRSVPSPTHSNMNEGDPFEYVESSINV